MISSGVGEAGSDRGRVAQEPMGEVAGGCGAC